MFKKAFSTYVVAILAVLFVNTVQATPAADDLAKRLNAVSSMQAQFVQTVKDNRGKLIQRSSGQMAILRPGKFRWDMKKPVPQLIIANNERLYIYDPDLLQVTIRPFKATEGEAPALLLSRHMTDLDKDFTIKILPAAAGLSWYELLSKQKDGTFANIQIGFKNNEIREMHLEDSLGQKTHIQFQRVKTNINLPASLFVYQRSAGVDVIDETRKR